LGGGVALLLLSAGLVGVGVAVDAPGPLGGSGDTTVSDHAEGITAPADRGRDGEVELPDRAEVPTGAVEGTDEDGGSAAFGPLDCRPNACAAWTIELAEHPTVRPIGDVLIEVDGVHARGHDAATGQLSWSRDLREIFERRVSENVFATTVGGSLALHGRGELALLDPADGSLGWHVDLGPRWVDRTGLVGDVVLVTTRDRLRGRSRPLPTTLLAFDARLGTLLWERRILGALHPPELPEALDTAFVAGGDDARVEERTRLQAPEGVLAVVLDRAVVGGVEVTTGDTVWERSAVEGQVVGAGVVMRAGNGRAVLLDGTTGETLTDLGDDVTQVITIGALTVVTNADDRSFVVDEDGEVTDVRDGPPLGWSATSSDTFIAWNDDGWVLIVRYERTGVPARARRLPGRIGSWGGELALGAHAGSDLVRAVGVDGRTTVAVRTDGPTEPPPNPSIAPSGAQLTLIGRTIVARDDAGITVQAPGGSVRVVAGREVIAVATDGTVVVRGERGLLGVNGDRLGPVAGTEIPGRP
jgi:outer membrane protein assembly factor BamB